MIIEDIKPVDKKRSKVMLDSGLVFVLYLGEIRRLGLGVGDELLEDVYINEIVPVLQKRVRERIVFILKARDKTEKELREKLLQGGYPNDIVDYGLSWAKQHNFINDARYLEYYVDVRSGKMSERKLRFDLKIKGFSDEAIEDAVSASDMDEESQINRLLKKKGYDAKETQREVKAKILASIVRKGYAYSKVLQCMKMYDEL